MAKLSEAVGPLVTQLVHPEPALEVGDLHDDGPLVQGQHPEPVDDVLVRSGDESLFGRGVVEQHGDVFSGAAGITPPIHPWVGTCSNATRRLRMLTIGHAHRYARAPNWRRTSSVIRGAPG